jgi:hypothetical protein
MARGKFDPKDFGVDMEREAFTDAICEQFNATFRAHWTIDELLLHPREALNFCDEVRRQRGWYMVPDDIILRTVLTRRKNP